jgi:Tfp pilus assembly protein FimV
MEGERKLYAFYRQSSGPEAVEEPDIPQDVEEATEPRQATERRHLISYETSSGMEWYIALNRYMWTRAQAEAVQAKVENSTFETLGTMAEAMAAHCRQVGKPTTGRSYFVTADPHVAETFPFGTSARLPKAAHPTPAEEVGEEPDALEEAPLEIAPQERTWSRPKWVEQIVLEGEEIAKRTGEPVIVAKQKRPLPLRRRPLNEWRE